MDKTVQNIRELASKLRAFKNELKPTVNEAIKDTFEETKYDLDLEFSHCVDDFYNEYTPTFYQRTDALYEGYQISTGKRGMSISWKTSANLIPDWHRVSPSYIYKLAYLKGYHGGHLDGDSEESYSQLSIPAMVGTPIDVRIKDAFEAYKASGKLQTNFDFYLDTRLNDLIAKYGLEILF